MMDWTYSVGLFIAFAAAGTAFWSLVKENDDLHRLILVDLLEVITLAFIALAGTDLAEALILPGLVVGISELMALSEIYLRKEGLQNQPRNMLRIEVMDSAPGIIAAVLVVYGIILTGFSGGAVAGLGILFYFTCQGHKEISKLVETASGYAWVLWIVGFFTFVLLPQYWLFAVMTAGTAILIKVMAKMALVGTMRGGSDV